MSEQRSGSPVSVWLPVAVALGVGFAAGVACRTPLLGETREQVMDRVNALDFKLEILMRRQVRMMEKLLPREAGD